MAYDPNYYQQQTYAPYAPPPQQSSNYTPHVRFAASKFDYHPGFTDIHFQGDRQLAQSRYSPQPAYPTNQSLTSYQPSSPGYDPRPSSRDERYLSTDDDRERRHRRRSHSGRSHRSKSRSRSRSHSRDLGASLLGAAGGGFIGHKYGGGALGAIGGAVAGAVATNFAEKEWEKHKEKREHRREYGGDEREKDKGGIVDTLLHPEQAIRRARSKVRDEADDFEDGETRRRRRRHRGGRAARSESRGYYEEMYEQKRRYRD
ncbi:MAG: hypothetical protein L6R37_000142 [Teloschistes peruensis]|nr:MAG: hypothetical protein L6R37_000142 [Teloschistes peruensis]